MCAVKVNGYALKYAPRSLRDDEEVVMAAVSTPFKVHHGVKIFSNLNYRGPGCRIWVPFAFASRRLRRNERILRAAIDTVGESLMWGPPEHKKNRDLMLYAISRHCTIRHSEWVLEYYKGDREVIEASLAISGRTIEGTDFVGDRELVLKAVRKDGVVLRRFDRSFRDDETVVAAAIQQCPGAIVWASKRLRGDYYTVIKALDHPLLEGTELRQGKPMDVLGQERWVRSLTAYDTKHVVERIPASLLENEQIAIAILRKEPALLFEMPTTIRSSQRMKAVARKYAAAYKCPKYKEACRNLLDKGEMTQEEWERNIYERGVPVEENYLCRDRMECKRPVVDDEEYLRVVEAMQMWQ